MIQKYINGKKHPIYNLWFGIKTRCYNKNVGHYKYYGGKGIKVCSEWLYDFNIFAQWCLDNGWKEGLTIDRLDSNKDYCPNNCQFLSKSENSKKSFIMSNCSKKGELHHNSSITSEIVLKVKEMLRINTPTYLISKCFNISYDIIYKIKHKRRWNHIS